MLRAILISLAMATPALAQTTPFAPTLDEVVAAFETHCVTPAGDIGQAIQSLEDADHFNVRQNPETDALRFVTAEHSPEKMIAISLAENKDDTHGCVVEFALDDYSSAKIETLVTEVGAVLNAPNFQAENGLDDVFRITFNLENHLAVLAFPTNAATRLSYAPVQ